MPSVERIKKHFNSPTFKKRIKEDKRLTTLQDRTEREADIEGIATDDSDDESDESTQNTLADMDVDAEMSSNWEHVCVSKICLQVGPVNTCQHDSKSRVMNLKCKMLLLK